MLVCAAEKCFYPSSQDALQALADSDVSLVARIERANGKRYLRKLELDSDVCLDVSVPHSTSSDEHAVPREIYYAKT